MLSRSEQLDIPDIDAERSRQAQIAALGVTIGQFQKTLQGRAIIEREERFVLGGMIYQGYNQKAVECPEDQLSDAELDSAHDVDGSKQRIYDTRTRRLKGAANAKDQELLKRRQLKIAQERDELELRRLQREEAKYVASQPDPEIPEPEPDADPQIHACHCGKVFDKANKLNAHKMGAKH